MRNKLLVFVLLVISIPSYAGKLEKGFEALLQLDYFKAKEYFEKTIEKQPAGSAFGLCKIYASEKSQFFNVDTAFKFIIIADKSYKLTSDKEIIVLTGLDVTSATIRREKVKLAVYFFERATEANTMESYQEYLDEHPNGDDYEEAEKLRNHLAFIATSESNSMEDYALFMKNYPEALDFAAAKQKFQLLEYKKLTREGNAYSYQVFIENKTDNPYTVEAQGVVYDLYTQDGAPESYEKFIEENVNNKHINEAWKYLYRYKTSKFTPAAISEFMIDYPNYPDYASLKEDLELAKTNFIPAKQGDKWGYIDTTGTWKINPKYAWASHFSEGKALVGFFGMSVFVDKRGGLVYPFMFEDAGSFSNNLAVVELEEKMGVIDYLGDTIVPIIYDELGAYSNGLIYAGLEGKYGYFNEVGEEIIPFDYESAYDFVDNKAIVKKDGGFGVVNVLGQLLVPTVYEYIALDSQQFVAKHGNMYGLISFAGDTLLPFEFDAIGTFSDNRAIAVKGSKYQYINQQGEIVINDKFTYDELTMNYSAFKNGYARIKSKGKVGIIDVDGKRVYPAIFNDVGYYDNVLTPVNKSGKWGFADAEIKLAIPYMYRYAYNFENGFAVVENDTTKGLINELNEEIIPFGYSKITLIDSNFILVEKNGLFGLLNYKNEVVVPVEYESADINDHGDFTFKLDNKTEIFWLKSGKIIYWE